MGDVGSRRRCRRRPSRAGHTSRRPPPRPALQTAALCAQPRAPLCASITAGAVLPAAAAVAAAPAPLPLAGLARDVQQAIVLAVAAARSSVFRSRGAAGTLHRRRRAKPAPKRASSSSSTVAVAPPAAAAAAAIAAPPVTAAATAAPAAAAVAAPVAPARALQQFLAGGVAGAVAKTLVAPMERVSTLLMADAQRFSVAAAARHAWRDGLYRGHAATLVKVRPAAPAAPC